MCGLPLTFAVALVAGVDLGAAHDPVWAFVTANQGEKELYQDRDLRRSLAALSIGFNLASARAAVPAL